MFVILAHKFSFYVGVSSSFILLKMTSLRKIASFFFFFHENILIKFFSLKNLSIYNKQERENNKKNVNLHDQNTTNKT